MDAGEREENGREAPRSPLPHDGAQEPRPPAQESERPLRAREGPGSERAPERPGHPGEGEPGEEKKPPMSPKKKRALMLIALAALLVLALAAFLYWLHARRYESTDDAFIDAYQSQVSAQVAGRVVAILVADNQHVAPGEALVRLDPRDFQVKLEQAQAAAASAVALAGQARADLKLQRANLAEQRAQVQVAKADLEQAQRNLARYHSLERAAVTRQQLDQTSAEVKSDQARLDSARQAVEGAQAQLVSQGAKIASADASAREAAANVDSAQLQLSYTKIVAPQEGRVTRRTVNLGNYVTPGEPMLAVVPDEMWVTANFKETQLDRLRAGQPVELKVDAFSSHLLHGHVDSIQRGTGAVFSSIPVENATGNYVKVVQRVPVKIVFDGNDWRRLPLAPGMSVDPRVTVR